MRESKGSVKNKQQIPLVTGLAEHSDTARDCNLTLAAAFAFFKKRFEADQEAYESKCQKNRESGEMGGRPKKANGSEKSKRFSSKPKKADTDKRSKAKTPCQVFAENSDSFRLAVFMRDTLKTNVPTLKEPDLQKWAKDFDVALRNDERMKEPRFVAQVIKWACSDSFWRANIQSPGKLREKFDQLTAKMESEAAKARASPPGKSQSPLEHNRNVGMAVIECAGCGD